MSSHLAFGKLIFQLLDKSKCGSVAKIELLKELDLDEYILLDLGFDNQENLIENLQSFKTEKEGFLEEQEFIAFLLSRSDLNEEFLENFKNNNLELDEGNNLNENNYENEIDGNLNYSKPEDNYAYYNQSKIVFFIFTKIFL